MKKENQLCNKEQSQKLKQLGIAQESLFYHYQQFMNGVETFEVYPACDFGYGAWSVNDSVSRAMEGEAKNEVYSAFTVAELGIMWSIAADNEDYSLSDELNEKYPEDQMSNWLYSPAFVADALIYSLEKGYITAQQVNERLKAA